MSKLAILKITKRKHYNSTACRPPSRGSNFTGPYKKRVHAVDKDKLEGKNKN